MSGIMTYSSGSRLSIDDRFCQLKMSLVAQAGRYQNTNGQNTNDHNTN